MTASSRSHARASARSHVRAIAALALLIAALAPPAAQAQEFLDVWKKAGMQTLITGPLRLDLAYTGQNGNSRPSAQ